MGGYLTLAGEVNFLFYALYMTSIFDYTLELGLVHVSYIKVC
jgi:hypothetical protein